MHAAINRTVFCIQGSVQLYNTTVFFLFRETTP
jgi:hypothetical protein